MASEKGGETFKPSWIDCFEDWVGRLPLRPWIFYAVFGITLILVQILFLWLDGGSYTSGLLPVIVFNGLAVPYLLALLRLLDNQALSALENMKSVLDLSQEEFETYKFRIANMPFVAPLLAGLAMTVFVILLPLVASEPLRYAALDQLSFFTIVYQIIDLSSAFLFGVVLYHTIRQLRLVYAINSSYIQVNIFQLRPVQAFSRLTASTAMGLVIFFYGWIFLNPELLADPAILVVSSLFTALAVLIFVWPLWGLHSLMVSEKEQALQEIEQQFEVLFNKFNHYVMTEDYDAMQELGSVIMSLEIQHNKVNAMPTWPWRSETARIVLTAVALPVLLMIVQFFVQQAIDR
jgi:hypothetical protein